MDTNDNKFVWENDITPDFVTRRSNFHGLTLKAMVEVSGTNMALRENYITEAKFYNIFCRR